MEWKAVFVGLAAAFVTASVLVFRGGCVENKPAEESADAFSCAPPTYAVSLGTVVCCAQDIELLGGRQRTVIQGCRP